MNSTKAILRAHGDESNRVATVIKHCHKRIRSLQYQGVRELKRKLCKDRKLHCISFAAKSSSLEKKVACLPVREIERDILQFNGEQLHEMGFEWKVCCDSNTQKKYRKLSLTTWMECKCEHKDNLIYHKQCIINIFVQSFILGALCMKFDSQQKDLKIPKRGSALIAQEKLDEDALNNLLLRIQYQSLRVNITAVSFDLFNRMDKCGYLTIKPSAQSIRPHASSQYLYNKLFQSHDALLILKNKSNHKQLFFGVALYQSETNAIKIKVHHQNIAMYDVYDEEQEWIVYAAPYCVKHAVLSLFQKCIHQQNES